MFKKRSVLTKSDMQVRVTEETELRDNTYNIIFTNTNDQAGKRQPA